MRLEPLLAERLHTNAHRLYHRRQMMDWNMQSVMKEVVGKLGVGPREQSRYDVTRPIHLVAKPSPQYRLAPFQLGASLTSIQCRWCEIKLHTTLTTLSAPPSRHSFLASTAGPGWAAPYLTSLYQQSRQNVPHSCLPLDPEPSCSSSPNFHFLDRQTCRPPNLSTASRPPWRPVPGCPQPSPELHRPI